MNKRIKKKKEKQMWGLLIPILRKDSVGQRMEAKRQEKCMFINLMNIPCMSEQLARKMIKKSRSKINQHQAL